MKITNIIPEQAAQFRELRLQALRSYPEAFSASYETFARQSLDAVKERIQTLDDNFVLGAFDGERLAGMAGFVREASPKLRHKGNIWGMYVDSAYRGQRVAFQLLEELIRRAGMLEGLRQILLGVTASNTAARKLYDRMGFTVYGVEPAALQYNDMYYDMELMVLHLPKKEERLS
ncbi:Putative phosphinothricin acetyltransferase YwnH [Paenibacillus konkukensis]|uniref:Phosphinothricin acetyltransferase YwnH n=1 Tax=Paenibacillus konkukensis TaxID=2020716 RepID=A0ABY4RYA4_9BACL|nr:GNAT family N-acetyltransferase [Paenibacillus konkukensis]UQZ86830.1 Putative phosphinothricin acetyltransferase YwnH [Paenibacillus konkukensis]